MARQSAATTPKTQTSIGNCAAATASLVAAMTPTLPVASRKWISLFGCSASIFFVSATMRSIVSALWSAAKSITGITLQSELSRPVEVGT